jgi:hypothetical protein
MRKYNWGIMFDDWKLSYDYALYSGDKKVGITSNYESYKSYFYCNDAANAYRFLALLDRKAVKSFSRYVDKRRKSETEFKRKKAEKTLSELGVIK